MTGIALLLISDGREEALARCAISLGRHVPATRHVIHVVDAEHRLGFAGAIREGWRRVLETDARFVFHVEQDFVFLRPVPLEAMARVLDERPHLVQLALLRQAVNAAERRAGGVLGRFPGAFERHVSDDLAWLEHRAFWTTNPSLYPRWVAERGWPEGAESEGRFGLALFGEDPARRAGYVGSGEEWVEHVGERAGGGY